MSFPQTLTFDDVLLVPQKSDVLPKDVSLQSYLTREIKLNSPFLSAAMDTVTEHKMATALALSGGIGIIHKNLSIDEQVHEIKMVKRFENGFIDEPMTIGPNEKISKVDKIRKKLGFKKIPVVDTNGVLVGIIRDIDYFVPSDENFLVKDKMVPINKMIIASHDITLDQANKMIRDHKLKTLCTVDNQKKLRSIVTRRDMEKNELFPDACKNHLKQLRVGAAIGAGDAGIERGEALIKVGADVLVIDTAHGHSSGVMNTLKELKIKYPDQQIIVGNIGTGSAAKELVELGADAVKVGIGPGSICTTRIVAGVGVPQLSAIMSVVRGVRDSKKNVPVIADGGIKSSGDVAKALAAGASSIMMGNMFAGTDESPGRVEFANGRMYKVYRGMGSMEAMEMGSKDRYGQGHIKEKKKFVPEGVSGKVLYKGPVGRILYQLSGGLRSGMGYCGSSNIKELQKKAKFIKISSISLKENHPHDMGMIEAAPNYNVD